MTRSRNQWKLSAKDFPPEFQLSLRGLESYYHLNYDAARAYVIDLAARRLRALQRKLGQTYLNWSDATRIADSELLSVLRCYQHVRVAKECPPWVVYVYDRRGRSTNIQRSNESTRALAEDSFARIERSIEARGAFDRTHGGSR